MPHSPNKPHSYFCYGIVLQDNYMASEFYPAFIVCWDNRVDGDKKVFILHRLSNIQNPVLTQTYEDIYELSTLYSHFRFTVRDKHGVIKHAYIKGILVAIPCNEDCTIFGNIYYYISHINIEDGGDVNFNAARWRDIFLEKEKESYIYENNWPAILSHEDGKLIESNYNLGTTE